MSSTISAGGSGRVHGMDSLRAAMMLLGVAFHATMPYSTFKVDRFRDHPQWGFDGLVIFIHSFRMPLFFLAAGFFAALIYCRRGRSEFLHNRLLRIALPLFVAWMILAPLTRGAYFFAPAIVREGSLWAGVEALQEKRWLLWSRPYQLWFLYALLAFYALTIPIRARLQRMQSAPAVATFVRSVLGSRWRAVYLAAFMSLFLIPSEFWPDMGVRGAWTAPVYFLFFGIGWTLYEMDILDGQRRHGWIHLAVGLALLPFVWIAVYASMGSWKSGGHLGLHALAGSSYSLLTTCLAFGILGLFLTHLDRPNPVARYLSDASYFIYLAHLPIVVVIGGLLAATELPNAVKLPIVVAAASLILFVLYELAVRETFVSVFLNGRKGASLGRLRAGVGDLPSSTRSPSGSAGRTLERTSDA